MYYNWVFLGFSIVINSTAGKDLSNFFYLHLKDVEELDDFYFLLLDDLIRKISKQNVKRAIIETYIKLLEFEGRLHTEFICLMCDEKIQSDISLVRSFHPVHATCTYSKKFAFKKIEELFKNHSLILFDDEEIEYLWSIVLQGL